MDVRPDTPLLIVSDDGHKEPAGELIARSRATNIQRLKDRRPSTVEPMLAAARALGYPPATPPSAWVIDNVQGPNIADKDTVVNLAEMAANSYAINESSTDWKDINGGFNRTGDFGWEGDGLRGHIFADENNSTILIGIKGTTPGCYCFLTAHKSTC
jgi:lipase ATG15